MQTLEQVKADVQMLPAEQQAQLHAWLENLLEDKLEMTDEFKAKIERGEQEMRASHAQTLIEKVLAGQTDYALTNEEVESRDACVSTEQKVASPVPKVG